MSAHVLERIGERAEIVHLDDVARDDWLALREAGVGASDAAMCLGVSPWRSPYQGWAERVGILEPTPPTAAMEFGLIAEPFIYDRYRKLYGPAEPAKILATSRVHPFMLCTPDAFTWDGAEVGLVEAKTVGAREAHKWGADIAPVDYVAQAIHQLVVCGVDYVDLVPLMLEDRDLATPVRIRWDDAVARELVDREAEWWTHVTTRTAPPADGSLHTERALIARYPGHVHGKTIDLTVDARNAWIRARQLRDEIADLDEMRRLAVNEVRAALGDAETGRWNGEDLLTWRAHTVREIDVERLRAEAPDIAERFTVTRVQRTMRPARTPRKRKATR